MRNMGSIILAHNQQVLCPVEENFGCKCRESENRLPNAEQVSRTTGSL